MTKPEKSEYDAYYERYISLVDGHGLMESLSAQPGELRELFNGVADEKGSFAYGEGKWTIKEVLSHLIDAERIFAYRVLRISRGDQTPIEGFEQDGYIENSNANNRPFAELLEEFGLVRKANLLLINNLSDDDSRRMGTASDNPVSA